MTPTVSLIIVSLGRPDHLRNLIGALRYQTHPAFEVVVVADSELDPQPGLLQRQFAEANISKARNIGLSMASGAIVAFCDDDAIPDPLWLERLTAPFSDARVGYAGGLTRGPDGVRMQHGLYRMDSYGNTEPTIAPGGIFEPELGHFYAATGVNCAFRASALHDIGGYDENYRYYLEDSDVCIRLANAGWTMAYVPEAQMQHFSAPSSNRDEKGQTYLHEIAASKAYFCSQHAGGDFSAALTDFRNDQHKALLKRKRKRDRDFITERLGEIKTGFCDGKMRVRAATRIIRPDTAAQTTFAAASLPHVLLAGFKRDEAALRSKAQECARQGQVVTVLVAGIGFHRLRCEYAGTGIWVHRGGLFGKMRPYGPAAAARTLRRFVLNEIARLEEFRPVQHVEPPTLVRPGPFGLAPARTSRIG